MHSTHSTPSRSTPTKFFFATLSWTALLSGCATVHAGANTADPVVAEAVAPPASDTSPQPCVQESPHPVQVENPAQDTIAYCVERIQVQQGECPLNPVPASMQRSLEGEELESFETMLDRTLNSPFSAFRMNRARGVLSVSSNADHECEGYPFTMAATGEMKQWGREWSSPITCEGNVCCLPPVDEGMSHSGMVFEHLEDTWVLTSVYRFPYEDTMSDEADAATLRSRIAQAERRRRPCR